MTRPSTGDVPGEPALAVGPRGEAIVVWGVGRPFQASVSLDAAIGSLAREKWQRTVNIVRLSRRQQEEGVKLRAPYVAIEGRGNAIVLWERAQRIRLVLQAAAGSVTRGRWQSPATLASTTEYLEKKLCFTPDHSSVGFDQAGDAVSLWSRRCAAPVAIERPVGTHHWRQPFDLSKLTGTPTGVEAALTPQGKIAAVWIEAGPLQRSETPMAEETLTTSVKAGVVSLTP
jgi:hypothetical protein